MSESQKLDWDTFLIDDVIHDLLYVDIDDDGGEVVESRYQK